MRPVKDDELEDFIARVRGPVAAIKVLIDLARTIVEAEKASKREAA
jgi:hypothetical protein